MNVKYSSPLASALRRPQIARSTTTKLQCPSLPAPLAVNNEPNRGRYTSWSHNNTPRVFGKPCSVNIFSIVNALHFDSCFGGGLASKLTKLSENLKIHWGGTVGGMQKYRSVDVGHPPHCIVFQKELNSPISILQSVSGSLFAIHLLHLQTHS